MSQNAARLRIRVSRCDRNFLSCLCFCLSMCSCIYFSCDAAMQDSPNYQTGDFLQVQLDWPSTADLYLSVQSLLRQHPGRSLQVRVTVYQTPAISWISGPQHFLDGPSQTWRCVLWITATDTKHLAMSIYPILQ
jgi:hypothetical protein